MKQYQLKFGDNIDIIRKMKENSVSSCACDPPYGLSKHKTKDIEEALRCWLDGKEYEVKQKGGFMGKAWDKFVPSPAIWREVYRVLKPGGYLLVFAGTRSQDLMGISIRLAGFELRDEVSVFFPAILSWNYGSGFPKSRNISKAIEKEAGIKPKDLGPNPNKQGRHQDMRGNRYNDDKVVEHDMGDVCRLTEPVTEEAKRWEGFGTALKPSHEPILVFRKPLEEKTVAKNVLKHGTGGINIDGCRLGARDRTDYGLQNSERSKGNCYGEPNQSADFNANAGRWPPNCLLVHSEHCKLIGKEKTKGYTINRWTDGMKPFGDGAGHPFEGEEMPDEDVEIWDCVDGCPVKEMDRQSGKSKDGIAVQRHGKGQHIGGRHGVYSGADGEVKPDVGYGGFGGASRFFPQFQYCAKANKKGRNEGLPEGMENKWPTVKPVKLMQWLVRLVTPPNGVVLDPFLGSGTTGVACAKEGFKFLGIEKEREAFDIAVERIKHAYENEESDE